MKNNGRSFLALLVLGLALIGCATDGTRVGSSSGSGSGATRGSKGIEVRINKNIELFGLLMQLELGPDALANTDVVELDRRKGQWRDWYRVSVRNYERYKGFADGAMMKRYRKLLEGGVYNDYIIGFLLQVDEVPNARLRADTDVEQLNGFSKSKELEEMRRGATEFLNALNDFYREVQFEKYLAENDGNYRHIKETVAANLPAAGFVSAMENFYQKRFSHYCLVPSMNIPTGMGFGKTHRGASTIYNVFGPFTFQELDRTPADFGFDRRDKILNLSVHEFGHSFVNPAIDKVPGDLIRSTEFLFTPIKEQLSKQSYPAWTIALYEHFVRAGEVIIARQLGNNAEAENILKDNATKGFIYLPAIVNELEAYAADRRHPGYDEFVPVVIERLKNVAVKN